VANGPADISPKSKAMLIFEAAERGTNGSASQMGGQLEWSRMTRGRELPTSCSALWRQNEDYSATIVTIRTVQWVPFRVSRTEDGSQQSSSVRPKTAVLPYNHRIEDDSPPTRRVLEYARTPGRAGQEGEVQAIVRRVQCV